MIQRNSSSPSLEMLRQALWVGSPAFLCFALIQGCSGDPAPSPSGGTGGATATGGAAPMSGGMGTTTGGTTATGGAGGGVPGCVTEALAVCNGCHSKTFAPVFGGLVLEGDVVATLVDKNATYNLVMKNPGSCVQGAKLIDSANPDNSVMLKKIMGTQACGDPMPAVDPQLTQAQKDCLINWIKSF